MKKKQISIFLLWDFYEQKVNTKVRSKYNNIVKNKFTKSVYSKLAVYFFNVECVFFYFALSGNKK
jgi:hypothetical protein